MWRKMRRRGSIRLRRRIKEEYGGGEKGGA